MATLFLVFTVLAFLDFIYRGIIAPSDDWSSEPDRP